MRFYELMSDFDLLSYYKDEYKYLYTIAEELAIDQASDTYNTVYRLNNVDFIMYYKGTKQFCEYCKTMYKVYEGMHLPMKILNSFDTWYSKKLYNWFIEEACRSIYIEQCKDSWRRSLKRRTPEKDRCGEIFFFNNEKIPDFIFVE